MIRLEPSPQDAPLLIVFASLYITSFVSLHVLRVIRYSILPFRAKITFGGAVDLLLVFSAPFMLEFDFCGVQTVLNFL